jgi:hypothetical protein
MQSSDSQPDYNNLIDMKQDQLELTIREYENNINGLKSEIVKCYEIAQPHLLQMRVLKQQLKKVEERLEAAKTFLSLEKNGSLVSSIELLNTNTERSLSLTDLVNYERPINQQVEITPTQFTPTQFTPTQFTPTQKAKSTKRPLTRPNTATKKDFTSPLVSNWMARSRTLK